MTTFFETLASPFFAVVDFALASPVTAAAMASVGAIAAILAIG